MAVMEVALFLFGITVAVFALPVMVKSFSESWYLDYAIRGMCIIMGLFLLALDASVMYTLADRTGFGIEAPMLFMLWLIMWACYVAVVVVFLTFGWNIFKMWGDQKRRKRMGEEND